MLELKGIDLYGGVLDGVRCNGQEVILEGPADCLGGETRVYVCGRGYIPVEVLYQENRSVHVVSRHCTAIADPPFIKGTARLYRVSTTDGRSFVATKKHRVLTEQGWAFVSDLWVGEGVPICDVSRPLFSLEPGQQLLQAPDPRFADVAPSSCLPPSPYHTAQWTTVSSIEFVREDVYYDLHVPGPENYLAEGMFHHNTGKTLGILWKLHRIAVAHPGAQLSILRKVRAHLYGTVLVTWKRDILPMLPEGYKLRPFGGETPLHYTYPNGPDLDNKYEGGSRIWLGGLDNPGQTLSGERGIIYVVQAEEITVSDWEYLIRMTSGRGSKLARTQTLGCCNPASQQHWIMQRWNKGNGSLKLFKTTHKDNPSIFDPETGLLTESGQRRLSALQRLTGHRLQRLYYGIWAPPEGAIFSMYVEETHKVVAFTPPADWPRFVGVDPFGAHIAAVWVAYDAQGMAIHIYREYLAAFGITTGEHVKAILKLAGYSATGAPTGSAERIFAWVGGGPSERQARLDFAGFGLPLQPSPVKDVWAGIGRISGLMREGRLFVHDCCVNLLSEIGDYRRKLNTKTGEFTDVIENKDSYHCIDSARYIISWLSGSGDETEDVLIDKSIPIGPRL